MTDPAPPLPVVGTSDQRRDARLKVFRATSLTVDRVSARCHILNLSTSGAMIDCTADMGGTENVSLKVEQLDQPAVICWRNGSRAGVRFARPLSTQQVRRCF